MIDDDETGIDTDTEEDVDPGPEDAAPEQKPVKTASLGYSSTYDDE